MSNFGQASLSLIGASIGWVFSGGNPLGAAYGFSLGMAAGSAAFPTDLGAVNGPRLNDLTVQSSAIGAPIPIIYGTYAVAGNVIWSSGIIESKSKKRQGGKGGPTQTVKTYTYSVNCAVGICEGPIGKIQRIWADAKLIYDVRPQRDDETDEQYSERFLASSALLAKVSIYFGDDEQQPDPTIESFEGAGEVSGFRGLAYVVFSEFQLEEYGNRVPNFRFEVSTTDGLDCEQETLYAQEVLYPWDENSRDPRHPLGLLYGAYAYRNGSATIGDSPDENGWVSDFAQCVDEQLGNFGASSVIFSDRPFVDSMTSWSTTTTPGPSDLRPCNPVASERRAVIGQINHLSTAVYNCSIPYVGGSALTSFISAFGYSNVVWWSGSYTSGTLTQPGFWVAVPEGESESSYFDGWTYPGSFLLPPPGGRLQNMPDGDVYIARFPVAPPGPCYGNDPSELPGFCRSGPTEITEDIEYIRIEAPARVLQSVEYNGDSPTNTVTKYPLGPARPVGHADYSSQAFWEAAYAAAVTAGDMPAGYTYGIQYPVEQDFYYSATFDVCTEGVSSITLGDIVGDICLRAGLSNSQIDVSDLTETVMGYAITRVMTARDAIGPLRSYGWFDCVESSGALKWPTRGKTAVAELKQDDLGAHQSNDSRPSAVETTRTQEVELPRRLRVHYAQPEMNYEQGEQAASRISVGTVEVRDLEVAIAMTDGKASAIADVVLYDLWLSRNRYRLIVDHSYMYLEPGDAITAPIDGIQERVRITAVDHALPGLLRLECVRDDDGVYQSYTIGNPPAYAAATGSIASSGSAELVLLDIPALIESHSDAGYYVAVKAAGSTTFGGATVFSSIDGGTTYNEVASIFEQASIGVLSSALLTGPQTIIDAGSELIVDFGADAFELESVTDVALLSGANAAAIGAPGRWEIIQFQNAEQIDTSGFWRLTGLLRGRRGTEWAVGTSHAGDRFVLLDSAVVRVSLGVASIGGSRPHRAVLSGDGLADSETVSFATSGVALRPFAPVSVTGVRDAGDLVISWIRRSRIGQELPSGTEIPLGEESESYDIDIIDEDGETVLRTLTSYTPTVTYTEAQQSTDFGSPIPDAITVRVYQRSAAVGRGYPAEATL